MTDNDYLIAWGLYAFAALGCLLVWFKLTGWMWRYLREPLRVIGAVLLFCPTVIDPVKDTYAPALAISALDLAFKVGNNVWRAVLDLATYGAIALGLYVIFALIRLPFLRRKKARQAHAEAAAAQAAAELKADDEPFAAQGTPRYASQPAAPAGIDKGGASGRYRVEPKL
ncbi:MFS transporter [Pseudomonas putida]|uniref:MFS transporter n=1 Tax=Pseudomonas putida TaxID=303 RepID=UPI002363B830|nr:MFS transporter [Pseudomonas putida]MDD1967416.1 MFS transporter [Pseudomonas putida]